jgi:tetratricopeptide (TPR) repeat protein
MRLFTILCLATGLMAQESTDARGWLNQGVQAFKAANYTEAIKCFERSVSADPNLVAAHHYLGTAYMQQYVPGRQTTENQAMADSATRAFLRVLEMEPQNTVAMASLASLNLNQKKWDEAQQWYGNLIAVDPANADAFYSLGFIAWSKWYPPYMEARRSLGMQQADPGPMPDGAAKQELKARYTQVVADGLHALNRALELKPDYADAMAYINVLIRERADLDDTKADYEREIATANDWVDKALAAKKKLAEGAINAPPPPSSAAPLRRRIAIAANVVAAKKVHDVAPVAPPLAVQAGITGTVRFAIVIGYDGKVTDIKVISGPPLLIPAAIEAIKQWEYRPTLLNGQPVEVQTEAGVEFR